MLQLLQSAVIDFDLFAGFLAANSPGAILGPIANFLGVICNFIFNIVYAVFHNGSLAVTIILFTIVVKALLFPLSIKQQKSMVAMRKLQPEIEKIQKKYKGTKDPELQKKMNAETTALYSKHKANPLSGCLPLLLQLPIMYALFYVMREAYLYINTLGGLYTEMSEALMTLPLADRVNMLGPMVHAVIPKGTDVYLDKVDDINYLLSKLTTFNWETLIGQIPANLTDTVQTALSQKQSIENFFTISLIETSGTGFPGIFIPLVAAGATFLSSLVTNKLTNAASNPQMKQQQKIMNIAMPLMMGFFAISTPAGVGLYWIMSSVTQMGQQLILNKMYPYNDTKKNNSNEIVIDDNKKDKKTKDK